MTSIIAQNTATDSQPAGYPFSEDVSSPTSNKSYCSSMRSVSRSSSVSSVGDRRVWDEKTGYGAEDEGRAESEEFAGIGLLPEEVYEEAMNSWRSSIRRRIRNSVLWETEVLAKMQGYVRTPFLDKYFVYTSSLGTHTFFMISLPAFVFFGRGDISRGLVTVLALGVYVSSFVKDAVCSPRPLAPPVTRLTIGTHHHEYGFPSTHTTNSVSMALFFFTLLQQAYTKSAASIASVVIQNSTTVLEEVVAPAPGDGFFISTSVYNSSIALLLFYVFSIVYGRLYTGMHSFTDCLCGFVIGTSIWALNLSYGDALHAWIRDSGWIVPMLTIPVCLLMVHWHPQPVDDCPCFEDAIAFISVLMGEILSRWYMLHNGYDDSFFVRIQPGSPWGDWMDAVTWWSAAGMKMIFGILIIFVWRILAKSILHFVLPPLFRLLAHAFTLPHRRFYTPATDYTSVPPEKGLYPIPSVIDLPSMMEMEMDTGASGHRFGVPGGIYGERSVKQRGAKARGRTARVTYPAENTGLGLGVDEYGAKVDEVKHYDADVLTKVVVYSGIGMLACGVIPVLFEMLGWGLRVS
ncbi:hypothetical protein DAEQUDRAFT_730063 [Daedalea quercina L-15889]|uniref:Phosphatidic acid phosphatase type 2/haloperoxidase domain-containing protein n=1 Tax=Daedalea quercina L-15889 TaxID=1314783 RepID=A0A165N8E5_9APHY|nr:hypothetical protein DAEQUDRAFT_730063 [Daedalea quercina L-15889]